MKVIGITGGVGSGKSEVMRLLKENYNAFVILADDVAKELMLKNQPAYIKVVERFGNSIVGPDGEIDRSELAAIVFKDKEKLKMLNSIVHPLVKEYITDDVSDKRISGKYELYFIEAALLIEDHYDKICDELWYIFAPDEVRINRLMSSRGYSREKCYDVMKNQRSSQEFERACDRIINNGGELKDTLKQLQTNIAKLSKC